MAADYERLARHFYKNHNIMIAEIDADMYADMRGPYGIRGYPTLKFFPRGSTTAQDANCGRGYDSMKAFIESKIGHEEKRAEDPKVAPGSIKA